METQAINISQTPKRNNTSIIIPAAVGAAGGALARYAIPKKGEMSSIFNKDSFDTFVSSASKRGASRSILKYTGIGALVALGVNYIVKKFKNSNQKGQQEMQYSKYGALIDACDYAVEIMWYGDK